MAFINSTNKKYAVLIGINYNDTPSSKLNGCINDVHNLKNILISKCGYGPENMTILVDDGTSIVPTKRNMIDAFTLLVTKATREKFTELWISYSGHGSNVRDTDG